MVEEARVVGKNLPISLKKSVEVCDFIRNKDVKKVKNLLNSVIKKKIAIPYKRYNQDTPHRRGRIAAGRYPIKTVYYFLRLIDTLVSNAENKGFNTDDLVISYAVSNQGEKQWHYGRQRRRVMKRAHLELRVIEKEVKKEKKVEGKGVKKEEKKVEGKGVKKEEKND